MTTDEYVDFALQVIRSNLDPARGYITAARLGLVLRRSQLEFNWESFGFPTLASFLKLLSDRGHVKVGVNEKDALSIWLDDGQFRLTSPTPPRIYNPLRKPMWVAFVLDSPPGRRFLHRKSGMVRLGQQQSPAPVDEWIEITPLSDDEQRTWALDFLRTHLADHKELEAAIEAPNWYTRFPESLRLIDPDLGRRWNRQRSLRISEAVEAWCSKNAIANELVFQVRGAGQAMDESRPKSHPNVASLDALPTRELVLSALTKLSTEDLLELPIAAKHLLAAIRELTIQSKGN